jgi:hypothetical protein
MKHLRAAALLVVLTVAAGCAGTHPLTPADQSAETRAATPGEQGAPVFNADTTGRGGLGHGSGN